MAARIKFTSGAGESDLRKLERTIIAMLGFSERNEGIVRVEENEDSTTVEDYILVLDFPVTKLAEENIYRVMQAPEFCVHWSEIHEEYRGW
jgi:hypothetical protein|nr:MAG TPA: hypothetical protein [Caudoviricetes sp.]